MKTITKLKKITGFAALTLGLLMFGSSANALPIEYQWDLFGNGLPGNNVNLGLSATYTSEGYDLGFTAFSTDVGFTNVIENNRGPNEEGLGVDGSNLALNPGAPDNGEINLGQFLIMDLGVNWTSLGFWQITFGSVDGTERAILKSGGITVASEDAPGAGQYINFIPTTQLVFIFVEKIGCSSNCSGTEDILLTSVRAKTPEPGTLIMMAMGLGLLGFSRRKSVK